MKRSTFRDRILRGPTLWAAGAHDALSARLIEEAGFEAVFTSGYGISASLLGAPDIGLYTMTENLAVLRNVVAAVGLPVFADADSGYGNSSNVVRTVREFEAAGIVALTLEDQETPKRCPLLSGSPPLLPLDEAAAKIRAAVASRRDPDLLIIGRTDAADPEEAVARICAYVAAGADLIQPVGNAFPRLADLASLRRRCGVPLSVMISGWYADEPRDAVEAVAGIATFPLLGLLSATAAMRENLKAACQARSLQALPHAMTALSDFKTLIGYEAAMAAEARHARSRE